LRACAPAAPPTYISQPTGWPSATQPTSLIIASEHLRGQPATASLSSLDLGGRDEARVPIQLGVTDEPWGVSFTPRARRDLRALQPRCRGAADRRSARAASWACLRSLTRPKRAPTTRLRRRARRTRFHTRSGFCVVHADRSRLPPTTTRLRRVTHQTCATGSGASEPMIALSFAP
jgi:hypothetical protein